MLFHIHQSSYNKDHPITSVDKHVEKLNPHSLLVGK